MWWPHVKVTSLPITASKVRVTKEVNDNGSSQLKGHQREARFKEYNFETHQG